MCALFGGAELSIISGATILGCEFSWVVFNEGCCYIEKAAEQ